MRGGPQLSFTVIPTVMSVAVAHSRTTQLAESTSRASQPQSLALADVQSQQGQHHKPVDNGVQMASHRQQQQQQQQQHQHQQPLNLLQRLETLPDEALDRVVVCLLHAEPEDRADYFPLDCNSTQRSRSALASLLLLSKSFSRRVRDLPSLDALRLQSQLDAVTSLTALAAATGLRLPLQLPSLASGAADAAVPAGSRSAGDPLCAQTGDVGGIAVAAEAAVGGEGGRHARGVKAPGHHSAPTASASGFPRPSQTRPIYGGQKAHEELSAGALVCGRQREAGPAGELGSGDSAVAAAAQAALPWLRQLCLVEVQAPPEDREAGQAVLGRVVAGCPALRVLGLPRWSRDALLLRHLPLRQLQQQLRTLDLSGSSVGDRGLVVVGRLSGLHALSLSRCRHVTARGIAGLVTGRYFGVPEAGGGGGKEEEEEGDGERGEDGERKHVGQHTRVGVRSSWDAEDSDCSGARVTGHGDDCVEGIEGTGGVSWVGNIGLPPTGSQDNLAELGSAEDCGGGFGGGEEEGEVREGPLCRSLEHLDLSWCFGLDEDAMRLLQRLRRLRWLSLVALGFIGSARVNACLRQLLVHVADKGFPWVDKPACVSAGKEPAADEEGAEEHGEDWRRWGGEGEWGQRYGDAGENEMREHRALQLDQGDGGFGVNAREGWDRRQQLDEVWEERRGKQQREWGRGRAEDGEDDGHRVPMVWQEHNGHWEHVPLLLAQPALCLTLVSLDLSECCMIREAMLRLLPRDHFPNLQHLRLRGCGRVGDGGVRAVVLAMPALRSLDIRSCCPYTMTDRALQHIARLRGLEQLCLGPSKAVTEEGLRWVVGERLTRLTSLVCYRCPKVSKDGASLEMIRARAKWSRAMAPMAEKPRSRVVWPFH